MRNDVDPQKTTEVVHYQLVAQNTYLKNNKRKTSIENHIKNKIVKKDEQRQMYKNLPNYAKELLEGDLISQESYDYIEILKEKYTKARKSIQKNSDDIFTSLFNLRG